jgi:hypothetical protein
MSKRSRDGEGEIRHAIDAIAAAVGRPATRFVPARRRILSTDEFGNALSLEVLSTSDDSDSYATHERHGSPSFSELLGTSDDSDSYATHERHGSPSFSELLGTSDDSDAEEERGSPSFSEFLNELDAAEELGQASSFSRDVIKDVRVFGEGACSFKPAPSKNTLIISMPARQAVAADRILIIGTSATTLLFRINPMRRESTDAMVPWFAADYEVADYVSRLTIRVQIDGQNVWAAILQPIVILELPNPPAVDDAADAAKFADDDADDAGPRMLPAREATYPYAYMPEQMKVSTDGRFLAVMAKCIHSNARALCVFEIQQKLLKRLYTIDLGSMADDVALCLSTLNRIVIINPEKSRFKFYSELSSEWPAHDSAVTFRAKPHLDSVCDAAWRENTLAISTPSEVAVFSTKTGKQMVRYVKDECSAVHLDAGGLVVAERVKTGHALTVTTYDWTDLSANKLQESSRMFIPVDAVDGIACVHVAAGRRIVCAGNTYVTLSSPFEHLRSACTWKLPDGYGVRALATANMAASAHTGDNEGFRVFALAENVDHDCVLCIYPPAIMLV